MCVLVNLLILIDESIPTYSEVNLDTNTKRLL